MDLVLTRDLADPWLLDFNIYGPQTDPILFSYDELERLSSDSGESTPIMKVIDSSAHPIATRSGLGQFRNRMPLDAFEPADLATRSGHSVG